MPWDQNGNFHPLSLHYLKIIFVKNSISVIVVHIPEIPWMPWWYVRIIKKSNPNLNYMHFETHLTMNLTRFFQLLAIFAALKCYHREYGKEKWHSFLPDVCPCEFVFIRFLDFEVWRHRQPHTTILRYESSTPTSQELSSPIFQSLYMSESGIGVTWPDLPLFRYI